MKTKRHIVHLPVYQPGKPVEDVKRELGLAEVIKLASNENPYGSSPAAKQAIIAEIDNSSIYPDGASVELTAAMAQHLGVQPNQLIWGNGADEIILMLARAYLEPGDETVMADQTFSQYRHNAEVENAVLVEVPLVNGRQDLPAMLAAVTDKTKLVWVCSPNNPTGTIVTENELVGFMDALPSHVLCVLDEAYCHFVDDVEYPDGVKLLERYPNLILLRTFSKIYGLAALRIGYGIAHPDVIHSINLVREPFNTARVSQAAAKAALADQAFVEGCRAHNLEQRDYLQGEFTRLGLPFFPTQANFVLVDVGIPSREAFDRLLRRGFITRANWSKYPTYLRVSIGKAEDNRKFVTALEEVLKEAAVQR
ncbi:histidinol-phosphate transaminase [Paenibacillus pasadenensis]|uniref:histidinol-phosphate transaminase n=1 Tax=Paenibacillus pasadenensis TaxID=217090 RepID=UPI00203CA7E6|nr:histidinol-phosphate transaminase [Paenibacillus pasadenensis]MCM3747418.1 histidinol-phosphate transaminase [Paenibacillus pasadenensis]